MQNPLWNFIDSSGTFESQEACRINTLYFPLCNNSPFMSSITPSLHGDSKTNNNSFLLEPVSRIDLSNSRSNRNFWVYINNKKTWSATGVSKDLSALKQDKFKLQAGLLWQKISRENKKNGLKAEITSFVPASAEPLEIMLVNLTNVSNRKIKFTPTTAIPIYARSADNLRDHRHVTSLLNRIELDKYGVIVTPTLLFDESGHRKNHTSYFVFGIDGKSFAPEYIYPTQEEFCGDGSDLEAPRVILENRLPDNKYACQGKEAMAGLRFKTITLKPQQSCSYIILMGIADKLNKIKPLFTKFNTLDKVKKSLADTQSYWQKKSSLIMANTGDKIFNQWFRWVSIQPELRRIFGCSFLPDFDYGKGGRGWRDLWQDCLSLILTDPKQARPLLINNFKGVRIDGSNATIIGARPGEFIADRNNISRVWMDHGIWPWFTTLLYIHQSADLGILLEDIPYFKDRQICRGSCLDHNWFPDCGKELKSKNKQIYHGSILEHLLVENLVQFFNVGPHNHIRLENADWNDGLDMAAEHGESVAFSAMYAKNLLSLADALEQLNQNKFPLLKELSILLDTLSVRPIDYSSPTEKNITLKKYFAATKYGVSGKKISVTSTSLIYDLRKKAEWVIQHIRRNEWLKEGFFNGYYDNAKKRAEGKINNDLRMTLTGQVFPLISGVATNQQIKKIYRNAQKYLRDKTLGGLRLNTDFKNEQLNLGRAFSFSYGDKENGAFFNHMSVMFAYGLYARGYAKEGYAALSSIYEMAVETNVSKIYPALPEYFNSQGRGLYCYLTGSASWFILTLLTQVFGIRGEYGDLVIEPKLSKEQFKNKDTVSITANFSLRPVEFSFINRRKKDFGQYSIRQVSFNKTIIARNLNLPSFTLPRKEFLAHSRSGMNCIEIILD
ncbi:MAG: cellobiose phosphorylase [Candidatus Omnitrophica bacterium]|jgi:cellobiose phosphorylase|nr:cellobiose phosphorylase [Candidatus Omnitrophota bacterium]